MKKVIVSHSGKQHVHRLVYALQQRDLLERFMTTVWQKPSNLLYNYIRKAPVLGTTYKKLTAKRYYAPLEEQFISVNFWPEISRFLKERAGVSRHKCIWSLHRSHDKHVKTKLKDKEFSIIVGYEMSSLYSFQLAKKLRKTTVLDLAQVHYNKIEELAETYEFFSRSLPPKSLRKQIIDVKEAELQLADHVIALSGFAKKTLLENGVPALKVEELNLGFDPANFKPKAKYNRKGKLKVLFVSTLTQRKGIHLLFEAVRRIGLDHVELTVIGPIADGHDLMKQYANYFTYFPYLPHERLIAFYQAADVYVLPSYLDSWAMVVLEAMACGTPVVVSENTGAAQIVGDSAGFVIPVDSVTAIEEKLGYFIENRDSLQYFGENAVNQAAAYTWQNYESAVVEYIRSLLYETA